MSAQRGLLIIGRRYEVSHEALAILVLANAHAGRKREIGEIDAVFGFGCYYPIHSGGTHKEQKPLARDMAYPW